MEGGGWRVEGEPRRAASRRVLPLHAAAVLVFRVQRLAFRGLGEWCLILCFGVWYLVFGVWFLVFGFWFLLFDFWFLMFCVW